MAFSRCCQCLNNLCDEQKNNWTDKTPKNLELCFNWIELFAKLPSHHQILNWQSRPSHDSELISPYCNSHMTLGTNSLLLLKKEKEMCQSLIQHSTLPFWIEVKDRSSTAEQWSEHPKATLAMMCQFNLLANYTHELLWNTLKEHTNKTTQTTCTTARVPNINFIEN